MAEFEGKAGVIRGELDQAASEWEALGLAGDTDLCHMRRVEARLASALVRGRALGLADEELRPRELLRRRVHNVIEDSKGQVRVYCRVRPLSEREMDEGDVAAVRVRDNMTLEVPQGTFSFDGVFAPGTQEEVFEDCRDLIQSAVDGHNVTVFAYGQTGAGKTYTMYGTHDQEGIAGRAIDELFRITAGMGSQFGVRVSASMVELYNNHLVDLLRPVRRGGDSHTNRAPSSQRSGPKHDGAGLGERDVRDAPELKALLERGLAQRTVAANAMNIESSRSHLVFTIRVTSVNRVNKEVLTGKILLCDLGGSERLKKSEAAGRQKKEAIEINKSLTALGDVIEAVARKQKQVPYRNHKLTQIMQDSLGGTAKTLMFVNCSPAAANISETVMSLMYAARAKRITNSGTPSSASVSVSSPGSPSIRRNAGGPSFWNTPAPPPT